MPWPLTDDVIVYKKCLTARSHSLDHVDLSSKVFCGIHLKAISHEVLMNLMCNIYLKIALLNPTSVPVDNELKLTLKPGLTGMPQLWLVLEWSLIVLPISWWCLGTPTSSWYGSLTDSWWLPHSLKNRNKIQRPFSYRKMIARRGIFHSLKKTH